jgi:uncharacterized protein (DUF2235 family)
MPKNIIICSDGTGNTAIKNRGTNVFKMFEAIDLNGHRIEPNLDPQIAFYDDGVGTESFLPLKLLGGAFGFGLAKNVRNLYMDLVRVYDPGDAATPADRIYLFGFSRGAFTVRTLAGLIAKCGVLDRDKLPTTDALRSAVWNAYSTYRRSYRTWLGSVLNRILVALHLRRPDADAVADFKHAHSLPGEVRIRFIGVWDTVDAVGGPFHTSDVINAVFRRFKFPDRILSDKVDQAVHALSLDEARAAFGPVLWEAKPNIEQVWFAGVHSNVGGGYTKQGMSLVTLDWMMEKAQQNGLRILSDDRKYYWEHGNVDDKMYDSRAGLGVFYRWKPRNMQKLCIDQKTAMPPAVHLSVLERIAHGTDGYAPGTLAPSVEITFTPSNDPDPAKAAAEDAALVVRAQTAKLALDQIYGKSGTDLNKVRGTVLIGRIAYYIYVLSCLFTILAASVPPDAGSRRNPWIVLKNAGTLIYDTVTVQWTPLSDAAKRLFTDPKLIGMVVAGFVAAGVLAYYVDHKRSLVFSRYWHDARQDLRTALKSARNVLLAARR